MKIEHFYFKHLIMAKNITTKQGILVIEINNKDAAKCNFGIGSDKRLVVCDNCNKDVSEKSYYIPVINRCLCEDCYNDFISHVKHYKEDSRYEIFYYNRYAKILGLPSIKFEDLKFDNNGIDDE